MSALRSRLATATVERAVRRGLAPRKAYTHYFIETEGLHSRIHLQNFYSTFWPQVERPARAEIQVYDADGSVAGTTEREIPCFGAMFLELRDLLTELGSSANEGTVAIDLCPADEVRREFGDLPEPAIVQINTPFWMAYYDADENYMYVHSIERLEGAVFGTAKPVAWLLGRGGVPRGERWRSWRLLDRQGLSELQLVVINHSPTTGRTIAGVYSADDQTALFERGLELRPRQLERVKLDKAEVASWADRNPDVAHLRVGLDPLLTGNGKPYVLMRYDDGPLSIHHG
jgi:hypothetical protein